MDLLQFIKDYAIYDLGGEVLSSKNSCLELAVSVGLGGVTRLKIEKIDVGLLCLLNKHNHVVI